ncbi:hypothetical protein J1614_006775 [Plenodomus biglobosus]|nr:hypothetical protein J1614_006775 [Plenodomus biglobosus]
MLIQEGIDLGRIEGDRMPAPIDQNISKYMKSIRNLSPVLLPAIHIAALDYDTIIRTPFIHSRAQKKPATPPLIIRAAQVAISSILSRVDSGAHVLMIPTTRK